MEDTQLTPRELNKILVNLVRIEGLTENRYILELIEEIKNILNKQQ